LEACAVVRQFDQPLLAAMVGEATTEGAFAELCRLSAVRPTQRGLALHDEVRRGLLTDLHWRDPARLDQLRARALAYYCARARTAPPAEREALVVECFALQEHAFVHPYLFE